MACKHKINIKKQMSNNIKNSIGTRIIPSIFCKKVFYIDSCLCVYISIYQKCFWIKK